MAKASAKDAVILVNGYALSTYALNYETNADAGKIDVTGFTDGCQNSIPGLPTASITTELFWDIDADKTWTALHTIGTTGQVSILPQGGTAGYDAVSMPFTSINFNPHGSPSEAIKCGSILFENYGTGTGMEFGDVLYHGTATVSTTGTGILDVSNAAATATCGAVLHIWTASTADTYAFKIMDSTDDITYADLVSFTLNGSAIGSERVVVASGTVDKYRKIVATRTGTAATPVGFTIIFWRGVNAA